MSGDGTKMERRHRHLDRLGEPAFLVMAVLVVAAIGAAFDGAWPTVVAAVVAAVVVPTGMRAWSRWYRSTDDHPWLGAIRRHFLGRTASSRSGTGSVDA